MAEGDYLSLNHHSVHSVKLIIGNGFDLACGLKSSYKDFFEYSKSLYDEIEKWIDGKDDFPKDGTIWDLFFILLSKEQNNKFKDPGMINWRDVENAIKVALGCSKVAEYKFSFDLLKIDEHIVKQDNEELELIYQVYLSINKDKKDLYSFLFDELKRFEKRFSTFLEEQTSDELYKKRAKKLLTDEKLLSMYLGKVGSKYKLHSIDTFNYTTPKIFDKLFEESEGNIKIRHVNGKIGGAIFGIDSQGIDIKDPRYKFTKAYRKLYDLADGKREGFKREFQNIVVFGHSLSEADYSYFFPILDKLDLSDFSKYQSRFIIAFNEFGNHPEIRKERVVRNVIELLDAYDKWKNPNSKRHGLIEMAATSDRLGFAKIDTSVLDEIK